MLEEYSEVELIQYIYSKIESVPQNYFQSIKIIRNAKGILYMANS